jgi:hypothetical protein
MKSTYLGKHYSAAIKGKQLKSLNIVKRRHLSITMVFCLCLSGGSGLIRGGAVVVMIVW